MTERKVVEQGLRRLLKSRPVPVDEERLEAMRADLLRRVRRPEPVPVAGFFGQHCLALSVGTAVVLVGLLVWRFAPLTPAGGPGRDASNLIRVVANEEQLDHMLLLLNDFASTRSQAGSVIDWDFYDRSWGEDAEGERMFETLYGGGNGSGASNVAALL
jgi:hypothetical protein